MPKVKGDDVLKLFDALGIEVPESLAEELRSSKDDETFDLDVKEVPFHDEKKAEKLDALVKASAEAGPYFRCAMVLGGAMQAIVSGMGKRVIEISAMKDKEERELQAHDLLHRIMAAMLGTIEGCSDSMPCMSAEHGEGKPEGCSVH